jgi:hypothetical protein
MKKKLQSKSNIANKVRNTKLPRTKPLMPLFEVISNSIHAIEEAQKARFIEEPGEINIYVIRNGKPETLKSMTNNDTFPVKSFLIKDNGIGLNEENLNYFVETDTDHKLEMGGKGIGRFVCLKAFKELIIESCYIDATQKKFVLSFEFRPTKDGFDNFQEDEVDSKYKMGTAILLSEYKPEYQKHVPRPLSLIAKEIVGHFQLYFIRDDAPKITVLNQNEDFVNCKNYYDKNFKSDVQSKEFTIGEFSFTLYLTKSTSSQSHKIHFCAHNRSVKEEGLSNKIIELGRYSVKNEDGSFYYQAFVVGDVLDENVDSERVGFDFPNEDSDDDTEQDLDEEITLSKIRREAIATIEMLLAEYLAIEREAKITHYKPIIHNELPQYRYLLTYKAEDIKRLPASLPKQKLDIELYKLETDLKIEVKEEGIKLLDDKKDIQSLEEYRQRYNKFLTEFNAVGKAELARYVVHRRAVIDLFEKLLEQNEEERFSDEDVIHSLFFPIRSASDDIPYDKQNLWLIDERLTYHSFLASDKRFSQIKEVDSNSSDRTDLLIFNDALVFSEDKLAPFQSFTIVEFKKPQREGYADYDSSKNPLDQVEKYINEIISGSVVNRLGRKIKVDPRIPFYVYIVCDITDSLVKILKSREFDLTPDGLGYFKLYTKYFNAYIEVLPFEKVLSDAQKRNRILFEKLGIEK